MGSNPSKEVCQCCEWRYSHTKYSKKGQLCKQCEKYYKAAALGEFEEHHDPGNDRGLDSPSCTNYQKLRKCNCCELFYAKRDAKAVKFECKKPGHILHLCINCGAHQIDNLRCPFPRSDIDDRNCNAQLQNMSTIAEQHEKAPAKPKAEERD